MLKKDFNFLLKLMKENAGWQFDEKNYFVIEKKIANFIRGKNYGSEEDLINELRTGNRTLINQVVETIAFSDTMFFRDAEVFADFKNKVLPKLKDKCRSRKEINVWSVGCSSGQETYSIAIIFDKCKKNFQNWKINISGSDISVVAINKSQRGLYNNFEIQTGLSIDDILEYFEINREQWLAKDIIRHKVDFRHYNVLDDIAGTNKFEVIFCRNLLKYFDTEHQDEILKRLSERQPQGGYLILGKNEKIPALDKYYYPASGMSDIYIAIGKQQAETVFNGNISISAPAKNDDKEQMPSFTRPKEFIR